MPNQHVEDPPNLGGDEKGHKMVRRGGKILKSSPTHKTVQFASRVRPDGSTAIEHAGADVGSSRCTVNRKRNEAPSQPKATSAGDGCGDTVRAQTVLGKARNPAPCRSTQAWNEWLEFIPGIIKDSGKLATH